MSVTCWLAVALAFSCHPCLSQSSPWRKQLRQHLLSTVYIKDTWYLEWTANVPGSSKMPGEPLRLKAGLVIAQLVLQSPASPKPDPDPKHALSVHDVRQVVEEAHRIGLGAVLLPRLPIESKDAFVGSVIDDWLRDRASADPERWFGHQREGLRDRSMAAEKERIGGTFVAWEFGSFLFDTMGRAVRPPRIEEASTWSSVEARTCGG